MLHETHPLLLHRLSACVHLQHYNFLWLSKYNFAWEHQTELSSTCTYAFFAYLLHYDLIIANIVIFWATTTQELTATYQELQINSACLASTNL